MRQVGSSHQALLLYMEENSDLKEKDLPNCLSHELTHLLFSWDAIVDGT